jgi:protein tyrosine/serine phosphatase
MQDDKLRKRVVAVIAVLVVVAAVILTIKYTRYHVYPKRFGVVEPGKIYRGGEQEAGPYRRIIEENGIRAIVTCMGENPDSHHEQLETRLVEEFDLGQLRFPMPGDGRGTFNRLEAAAAAIADPENQPVFLHCAAGVHRTGATIAVYRMKYCGWDLNRALAELRENWIEDDRYATLSEHLRIYHRERIAKGEGTGE